jgi:hypothetical protein
MDKTFLSCLLLSLAALSFSGPAAAQTQAPLGQPGSDLDQLMSTYWEDYLQLDPITATFIGDDRYNDRLPVDISRAHRAGRRALYVKYTEGTACLPTVRVVVYGQQRRDGENQWHGGTIDTWTLSRRGGLCSGSKMTYL